MKVELGEQNSDLTVCHREGCGRIFKKPPQLKRHLESHNKFPFQCDKENCKKMFRFEESLSLHKFSYHGMKEELKRSEPSYYNNIIIAPLMYTVVLSRRGQNPVTIIILLLLH